MVEIGSRTAKGVFLHTLPPIIAHLTHLYTLIAGAGGHAATMEIICHIMDKIFVFSRYTFSYKHRIIREEKYKI